LIVSQSEANACSKLHLLVIGIFISIFLSSTSCNFQWSDRAIYIHEFG
jgi:hypothetical protein